MVKHDKEEYIPDEVEEEEEDNGVEFVWKQRSAKNVKLAVDFNEWNPEDMVRFNDDDCRLFKDLGEGEYDYKFVVDDVWCIRSCG